MTHQKVIDRLVALGLTTYEAKVFSALTRLGEAGVSEIHAVAEVPRSAVYGTLEKLERRGIIETSPGRPKKFRALPPKVAVSKIESELRDAVKDAKDGLEELASIPHREASDVRIWIVKGRTRIRVRLEDMVAAAGSELMVAGTPAYMMTFADTLYAPTSFGSSKPAMMIRWSFSTAVSVTGASAGCRAIHRRAAR